MLVMAVVARYARPYIGRGMRSDRADSAEPAGRDPDAGPGRGGRGHAGPDAHDGARLRGLGRPDGPRTALRDRTPMRVPVVEEEGTLAQMLTMGFDYEGWAARTAPDGPAGVRAARE